MLAEITRQLIKITPEEQRILDGDPSIQKSLYTSADEFIVDGSNFLERGRWIDVRVNTRFVYFPPHRHNYVEMMYMLTGRLTTTIDGTDTIQMNSGDILLMNRKAIHDIRPCGRDDLAINFLILPEFFARSIVLLERENLLRDFFVHTLSQNARHNGRDPLIESGRPNIDRPKISRPTSSQINVLQNRYSQVDIPTSKTIFSEDVSIVRHNIVSDYETANEQGSSENNPQVPSDIPQAAPDISRISPDISRISPDISRTGVDEFNRWGMARQSISRENVSFDETKTRDDSKCRKTNARPDARKNKSNNYLLFHSKNMVPVENLIENLIWNLLICKRGMNIINQTTMELLFMNLASLSSDIRNEESSSPKDVVITVLEYIDQNFRDGTLEEAALKTGYSTYYLSRLIKERTGQNFKQLLQIRKLQQAVYYLENTILPIDRIIEKIGYENSSYFYRVFRERYKISPREFRKLHLLPSLNNDRQL